MDSDSFKRNEFELLILQEIKLLREEINNGLKLMYEGIKQEIKIIQNDFKIEVASFRNEVLSGFGVSAEATSCSAPESDKHGQIQTFGDFRTGQEISRNQKSKSQTENSQSFQQNCVLTLDNGSPTSFQQICPPTNSEILQEPQSNVVIKKTISKKKTNVKQTKRQRYSCRLCNKKFSTKELVVMHKLQHNTVNPRRYTCHVCEKGFEFQCNWKRHMRCHTGERPFVCEMCDKAFTQKAHLQKHLQIHEKNVHKTKRRRKA
uniref:ZF(C2H2)-88 zinc finger protein n=1 Tax=Phallusia mammillata TaxID=59560 RepID=A0A6F9DXZ9_9ASCI|nr:ZF(C2H2)-88 zinc finger protein [Phallusia mammillata]